MNNLPVPIMSIATHQMSGRGRGGNVWLSPPGVFMFSTLLRVSYSPSGNFPYLPTSQLVYIQYLFGIAVVEACQQLLGDDSTKVRLKWPNDIYAVIQTDSGTEKKKLGGILVGTTFRDGDVIIVVGKIPPHVPPFGRVDLLLMVQ